MAQCRVQVKPKNGQIGFVETFHCTYGIYYHLVVLESIVQGTVVSLLNFNMASCWADAWSTNTSTFLLAGSSAGPSYTERYDVLKVLGAGLFGTVHACISKEDTDEILRRHINGEIDQQEACQMLCSALRAVKSAGGPFGRIPGVTADLRDEVNILRRLQCSGVSGIIKLTDYDSGDHEWLAEELPTGGTLDKLVAKFDGHGSVRLPGAFAWHVLHDLASTPLAMQTGGTGDLSHSSGYGLKPLCHCDIHGGNIMFRQAPATGGPSYPQVILIDFGTAQWIDGLEDSAAFRARQRSDIKGLLRWVGGLFRIAFGDDNVCLKTFSDMPDSKSPEHVLAHIVKFAGRRKVSTFQPLPTGVLDYFARQVVSDDEFMESFPQLQGEKSS